MNSLDSVLAVILGGGRGSRLYPLTHSRSKPAIPIAGKYRLIDVPLSNCINSRIFKIAVLTQFNSVSLTRHIGRTYIFDNFHGGWVQIWAAEQTIHNNDWYQGTADAVRKQIAEIKASRAKDILILAGDHLYRMDYAEMINFHWAKKADITIAAQPVNHTEAHRLGIIKIDSARKIIEFMEKPCDDNLLKTLQSRNDSEKPYFGSMGIYLFRTEVLIEILNNFPEFNDFGEQVLPHAIHQQNVFGFEFDGFWKDIGTIRSFYETNLLLTQPKSPFVFLDANFPIYGGSLFLPCSEIRESVIENVLLADGCRIKQAKISDSIIGVRSIIDSGVTIERSIIMGADYYENSLAVSRKQIHLGIGADCVIRGAIIDKNACLGQGVRIEPFPPGTNFDADNWVVRDGIVIIPDRTTIATKTKIMPE